ncbi:sulfotransferase domain-containing protein [Desulfotignum balticum]|uniref:sulfotransferase domain-containing protein n=1 Tax=Desulfotignum balticum TaxID=115781 RepID=UPI00040EEAFB|nr:sulfotransferase domain-containing protein [Desulfotignum balticum]
MLNKNLKKLKKYITKSKHHCVFQHNDIFLVEFPKSGVTYLSFLVANALKERNDEEITFYNHHKYIVDFHQLRGADISTNGYPLQGYRFIKSHSDNNTSYYFVIYILRNPFDVMLSYYYFMSSKGYKDSFESFIQSKRYGIQNWVNHVEGWLLEKKDLAQRIHLIKYENLVFNPQHELADLFENIGLVVNDLKLEQAIRDSSKDSMKYSEQLYAKYNPVYKSSGMNFVRKGKVNQKDLLLNTKNKNIIYNKSSHIINMFYENMII